jgi:hypothetical protein
MASLIREVSTKSGGLESVNLGSLNEAVDGHEPSHCSSCPPLESAYCQGDGPIHESQSDVWWWPIWKTLFWAICYTLSITAIVVAALHFGVRSEEFVETIICVIAVVIASHNFWWAHLSI